MLSVQSNDATFEREGPITEESGQQLAMARLRAVEFDRALVYSSTTGYSAIIAPDAPSTWTGTSRPVRSWRASSAPHSSAIGS